MQTSRSYASACFVVHALPSLLIVVVASIFLTACSQKGTTDADARLAKLEQQVQSQDKKIKLLARAATLNRASIFDDPLDQFFDAPEFWQVVYEDKAACYTACFQNYKGAFKGCNGEKPCEQEVANQLVACNKKCDPDL
jgi:hypothetical protein